MDREISLTGLGLFMTSIFTNRIIFNGYLVSRGFSISKGRALSQLSNDAGKITRKKSSIYTKTGDKGSSSLYNGERRPKTDITFDALGNSDELNAVIGIAREHSSMSNNGLQDILEEIQSRLFDVGAAIATPLQNASEEKKRYVEFPKAATLQLEAWIDEIDATLPPLHNFVIPSGGMSSVHLNLARTVCRRCERSVVSLVQSDQVDSEVAVYLNRLSDLLFVLGRAAAHREKGIEKIWKKASYTTTT